MGKGKLERFSLAAIAKAVSGSDIETARRSLSAVVGAAVDVSGKVQKVVKRDGCKLVIEPSNVLGFVVFADCLSDAETVRASKIRRNSSVRLKGKLQTFGAFRRIYSRHASEGERSDFFRDISRHFAAFRRIYLLDAHEGKRSGICGIFSTKDGHSRARRGGIFGVFGGYKKGIRFTRSPANGVELDYSSFFQIHSTA
jgi:hypothetical protein